jgi:hypothetical protein
VCYKPNRSRSLCAALPSFFDFKAAIAVPRCVMEPARPAGASLLELLVHINNDIEEILEGHFFFPTVVGQTLSTKNAEDVSALASCRAVMLVARTG